MPVALKFEADRGSLDSVRSDVNSFFDGLGEEAGQVFSRGMSNVLSGALSGATSQFGGFGKAAESALSGIVSSAGAATLGIAGMAAAVLAVGKSLYDMGAEWDKIGDSITGMTGATGAQLDGLVESVRAVGRESTLANAEISKLAGGVSASLHLSGQSLNEMTDQLAKLKELTGESVDTKDLGKAFRLFDVQGVEEEKNLLNDLRAVSQATQTPVNELVDSLLSIGPSGREAGLGLRETLGMLVAINDAGLDAGKFGPIFTAAMRNWTKEGKDASTQLDETLTRMRAFIDANQDDAARGIAFQEFGKNAQQVFDLVKDGTLDVKSLHDAINKLGDTKGLIDQQRAATKDWDDDLKILSKTLKDDLYPVAHFVFGGINAELQTTLGLLTDNGVRIKLFGQDLGQWGGRDWGLLFGDPKGTTAQGGLPAAAPGQINRSQRAGSDGVPPAPGGLGGSGGFGRDLGLGVNQGQGGFTPTPKPDKAPGGGSGELVPYAPGYGVMEPGETPEHYRARMNVLEQQHNVAEKQAELDKLEASGVATREQIVKANNDILEAKVRADEALQALNKPATAKAQDKPEVPYGEGYGAPIRPGQSLQQYQAEQSYIEAQHSTAEARANLLQLERSGVATANDLAKARNDLQKAEQSEYEAQLRLTESTTKSSKQMDEFGASIDKDFGLSRGLPGLAENLAKFIGSIAAAPLMGVLGAVSQSQGGIKETGSGLIAMAVAAANPPQSDSTATQYAPTAYAPGLSSIPAPTMLNDTGSKPSGVQSRTAAALIEQQWGSQLRGKIGGSRDNNTAPGTHDAGLAIDIPIGPDQGALGDQINSWLQSNAGQLGLKYSIWRDRGKYPGGGGFNQPGHQNHIDAQFDGSGNVAGVDALSGGGQAQGFSGSSIPIPLPVTIVGGTMGGANGNLSDAGAMDSASMNDPGQIAKMIYGMASQRGYSKHDAQSIVAYALGESSLNPKAGGGVQGGKGDPYADNVMGLFQQKPDFARGGGIDPSQRTDPYYNTLAYLNQLEKNRGLPIEQALPRTSVGGPLAPGGEQPWGPLMQRAGNLLGLSTYDGGGPLMPGITIAQNNTGKPETVLTNDQMKSVNDTLGKAAGPNPMAGTPAENVGAAASKSQGPTDIGGAERKAQDGSSAGGGGGLFGAAVGAGAMAADMFAPGSGAAVQIAGQEIQRAIKAGGQAAGILTEGLMETFLPTGASEIANDSWLTRIAGGFVGLGPQLPNMAGKPPTPVKPAQQVQAPPMPMAPSSTPDKDSKGSPQNVTLNINGVQNVDESSARMLADTTASRIQTSNAGPGSR